MRTVDLFCGAGGFSLGFHRAGYNIVAAFDNWKPALDTHAANMPYSDTKRLDLADVDTAVDIIRDYAPECIIGGPPCQDFSLMGNRVEKAQADLTCAFAEICRAVDPALVVMENVPAARETASYQRALSILPGHHTLLILNAAHYGVPQYRKRLFCIATGHELHELGINIMQAATRKPLTCQEYAPYLIPEYYAYQRSNNPHRAIYSRREPAPTILTGSKDLLKGYKPHPMDATTPDACTGLSLEHCAIIQTFPPDYQWVGSKTSAYKLIGNAVPPNLAEHLGRIISAKLAGNLCPITTKAARPNSRIDQLELFSQR